MSAQQSSSRAGPSRASPSPSPSTAVELSVGQDSSDYRQRKGYCEDHVFNNPLIEQYVASKRRDKSKTWRGDSATFSRLPFRSLVVRSTAPVNVAIQAYEGGALDETSYGVLKVCISVVGSVSVLTFPRRLVLRRLRLGRRVSFIPHQSRV